MFGRLMHGMWRQQSNEGKVDEGDTCSVIVRQSYEPLSFRFRLQGAEVFGMEFTEEPSLRMITMFVGEVSYVDSTNGEVRHRWVRESGDFSRRVV